MFGITIILASKNGPYVRLDLGTVPEYGIPWVAVNQPPTLVSVLFSDTWPPNYLFLSHSICLSIS